MSPAVFVSLEGLVGSGKTSLISLLASRLPWPRFMFITEPVDAYNTFLHHHPLELSYTSPKQNFPMSQLHIMKQNLKNISQASTSPLDCELVLCERSLASATVFINTAYDLGHISEYTRDYLLFLLNHYCLSSPKAEHIIYLHADKQTISKRVRARARTGEQHCTLAFQETLQKNYNVFLTRSHETGAKIHHVSNNADTLETAADEVTEILLSILKTP